MIHGINQNRAGLQGANANSGAAATQQSQQSSNVAHTTDTQTTQQAGQGQQSQGSSFHPGQEMAKGPQARLPHQAHQLDPSALAMTYASSENSGKMAAAAIAAQDQMHQLLDMEVKESKTIDDAIEDLDEYGGWNPEDEPEEEEDWQEREAYEHNRRRRRSRHLPQHERASNFLT